MRSGVAPVCVRLCRTPQNRRDTTADGLKDQPSSHHWPLLRQPDCCCRARRSPPAARFPHRSHPAPAASSLRGFSTRADTGPAATVTPRPASKNLHQSGHPWLGLRMSPSWVMISGSAEVRFQTGYRSCNNHGITDALMRWHFTPAYFLPRHSRLGAPTIPFIRRSRLLPHALPKGLSSLEIAGLYMAAQT